MNKRIPCLIITAWAMQFIFGTASRAQNVPYYHFDRSFTSAEFNIQGNLPTNLPAGKTPRQTGIVRGAPVKIDTSNTYAIERQAIVLGYESAMGAWNAATNNAMERRHPGKIFDNAGWICGTRSLKGKWGAYLWTLQNRIAFRSSETNWWEIKDGVRVPITNVMVGSLGNYPPQTNVVDTGPDINLATNFPGADKDSEGFYQADLTNVFYQLMIPHIRITPWKAVAVAGSTNSAQFAVTGTNIPKGVNWAINPSGLAGGAVLQVSNDWHFAGVMPGTIVTNYKARVNSADITNFYDEAELEVIKIDIMETNLYLDVSNTAVLHLTPDSSADAQWEITPVIRDGVRFDGNAAGTSVIVNTGSIATNYTIKACAAKLTDCFDTCTVTVLNVALVPDWNHDRTIDDSDKNQVTASNPFRFWINDDDDSGDISSGDSDLPGHSAGRFGSANYANNRVNGRSDLLDFFPLWLDLRQTLDLLPPSNATQYKLRQDDAALKAVYTDLTRERAGSYLTTEGNTYGPSFKQNAYQADTFEVTTSGVTLAETFLNKIRNDEAKGVLIMEGAKATKKPLVLEIWKDGQKIYEKEMPLSIAGVEKMYRWINLRGVAGGGVRRPTDTSEPANYPDALCNGKQFVFVHGYNVHENGARAWNAEMFKRLYQSRSRVMFTAVAWFGNDSQIASRTWFIGDTTPDYYLNVEHAFATARDLTAAVNVLPGRKYIAAHSLGNMLVSSAIKDCALRVTAYFMFNAAVPMEAYDANTLNAAQMRHPGWRNYGRRLWAAEWHRLFDRADWRHKLTWRGRFGKISVAYKYYSSTEDVLDNGDGKLHNPFASHWAWYNQEVLKGAKPMRLLLDNCEGGWGFNPAYKTGSAHLHPESANLLTDNRIRTNSFFGPFKEKGLYGPHGGAFAHKPEVYRQLLADAIPALSFAMGKNDLGGFGAAAHNLSSCRRGDYPHNWPDRDDRWRHSHIKDVAFPFNYRAFDKIIIDGGLK